MPGSDTREAVGRASLLADMAGGFLLGGFLTPR
jgi:hypothetical protein